jgi:DNA-binding MarR family transcriptional regulator
MPILLRTARRTYATAITAELHAAGFLDLPNNSQYVIRAVAAGGSLSEIARDLLVSKQAASRLIDQLVLRGYLVRTPDAVDRRRITLELSARGERAAEVIAQGTRSVDEALTRALSARQLAGLYAGLDVLVHLFERLEDEAS